MKEVEEEITDGRVLELIDRYLKQGVMEGRDQWEVEKGTPQGAVISPLLANIYLNKVDHEMKKMLEERDLILHPEKTRIVDAVKEGFDFLGYHFESMKRWPRKKSMDKIKETIRTKTRRTSGKRLVSFSRKLPEKDKNIV